MAEFEERPEEPEQEVLFDNMSFRLCMDGIWASIKLNRENPNKGMTKEQAEERLKTWFPEATSIEVESPPVMTGTEEIGVIDTPID